VSANPHRGEIAIRLDGQDRILRPDFEGVAAIDRECGSIIELGMRAYERRLSLPELALVITHGLRGAGRAAGDEVLARITQERVAKAIFDTGVMTVLPPVLAFLGAALAGGKDAPEGNAPAATE
jgi:hypothetical protein